MRAQGTHSLAADRAAAKPVSTWAHISYAVGENGHLGRKTMWLLDVDWKRARARFASYGPLDQIFHLIFCWEWWAVAHFRFSHWAHKRLLPDLGRYPLLRRLLFLQQAALLRFCYATGKVVEGLSGARLEPEAEIGPGLLLMHTGSCGIGRGSRIGCNFTMFQDSNIVARRGGYPVVGDNVTLYSGARVIGLVRIGDGTVIGANAVVLHDLPTGCVAFGVPARPSNPDKRPEGYSAAAQIEDLLTTLVTSGSLSEQAPGRYFDSSTGTAVIIQFAHSDQV